MLSAFFSRRFLQFYRFNLPAAVLVTLLQRTPVLRLAVATEEMVIASPMGAVLKSVAAVAASLGAMHSLAGATQLFVSPAGPTTTNNTATVGTAKTILFTVTGAPVVPGSWTIGNAPPGMNFAALNSSTTVSSGIINASTIQLSGTPTTAGSYSLFLKSWQLANGTGDQLIWDYTIVVSGGTTTAPPTVATQPQSVTVASGNTVALTVSGTNVTSYQWQKNGVAVAGATTDTLILSNATAATAGNYTAVLTNAGGSVTSSVGTVTIGSGQSLISNLSVRTNLGTGQSLTVGFVTNGSKSLLLRAVGPTLGSVFGLTNFYADPSIKVLSQTQVVLGSNDNWSGDAQVATAISQVGAFPLASSTSKDAALVTPANGPATVQVAGTGSGIVLMEVYDTSISNLATRLTNVSARNNVGTGTDVLVSGFVIAGPVAKTLLIRGIGPALKDVFGVSGNLVDPKLEIFTQAGVKLAENDNWNSSLATYFSQVGAYAFNAASKDSALLITLPPGVYTAQVSGVSSGTGDGVVEVYEVP